MKKIIIIIISAIFAVILLFPIKSHIKDGGTVKYDAILYGITKKHAFCSESVSGEEGFTYNIGTSIRILWFNVYDSNEFIPIEDKGAENNGDNL